MVPEAPRCLGCLRFPWRCRLLFRRRLSRLRRALRLRGGASSTTAVTCASTTVRDRLRARPRRPALRLRRQAASARSDPFSRCEEDPSVRHRRARRAAGKHAKGALAIALETQQSILLAGAHQIGDRSVLALIEIRLRVAKELLELARIHRPPRFGRGFGKHAAHERHAVTERRVRLRHRIRLLEQFGQRFGLPTRRASTVSPERKQAPLAEPAESKGPATRRACFAPDA